MAKANYIGSRVENDIIFNSVNTLNDIIIVIQVIKLVTSRVKCVFIAYIAHNFDEIGLKLVFVFQSLFPIKNE